MYFTQKSAEFFIISALFSDLILCILSIFDKLGINQPELMEFRLFFPGISLTGLISPQLLREREDWSLL